MCQVTMSHVHLTLLLVVVVVVAVTFPYTETHGTGLVFHGGGGRRRGGGEGKGREEETAINHVTLSRHQRAITTSAAPSSGPHLASPNTVPGATGGKEMVGDTGASTDSPSPTTTRTSPMLPSLITTTTITTSTTTSAPPITSTTPTMFTRLLSTQLVSSPSTLHFTSTTTTSTSANTFLTPPITPTTPTLSPVSLSTPLPSTLITTTSTPANSTLTPSLTSPTTPSTNTTSTSANSTLTPSITSPTTPSTSLLSTLTSTASTSANTTLTPPTTLPTRQFTSLASRLPPTSSTTASTTPTTPVTLSTASSTSFSTSPDSSDSSFPSTSSAATTTTRLIALSTTSSTLLSTVLGSSVSPLPSLPSASFASSRKGSVSSGFNNEDQELRPRTEPSLFPSSSSPFSSYASPLRSNSTSTTPVTTPTTTTTITTTVTPLSTLSHLQGGDTQTVKEQVVGDPLVEPRNLTPAFRTGDASWLSVLAFLRGDCDAVDMSDTEEVFRDFVVSFSSLLLYSRDSIVVQDMKCHEESMTVNLTINTSQHPSCEADLATLTSHRNLRVNLHGASFYIQTFKTERSHLFETKPGRKHDRLKFLFMALGGVGVSLICVALAGLIFATYQRCATRRAKLVLADDRNTYTPSSSSYRTRVRQGEDHRVRFADAHSFKVDMYRSYSDLSSPDLFAAPLDPKTKGKATRTREEVWEESFTHRSKEYSSVRGVSELASFRADEEPVLHPLLLNGRPNITSTTRDKPGKATKPNVPPKPATRGKPGTAPKPTTSARTKPSSDNWIGTNPDAPSEPISKPGLRNSKPDDANPGCQPSPEVTRDVLERMDHLFASALSGSAPEITPTHTTVTVSEMYSYTTMATSNTTTSTSLFTHAPTHTRTTGGAGEPHPAPLPPSASSDSLCLTRITFMEMCVWPDSPSQTKGKRTPRKIGTCKDGKK